MYTFETEIHRHSLTKMSELRPILRARDESGRTSSVLLASMDINERHSLLIVSAGLQPPFLPAHAHDSMAVPCLRRKKEVQQNCQTTLSTAASTLQERTNTQKYQGRHCVAEAT